MIYSVMVNYEAPNDDEARALRERLIDAIENDLHGLTSVSGIATVAPLVQFDEDEEDEV